MDMECLTLCAWTVTERDHDGQLRTQASTSLPVIVSHVDVVNYPTSKMLVAFVRRRGDGRDFQPANRSSRLSNDVVR